MPPAPRRAKKRGLLVGCAVVLGLLIGIELALRIAGFENADAQAPMLVWNPAEDELMASGSYLYQFDENALWAPRPGHVIQFGETERIEGPPEYVNEDGFRGPRVPREKTPGVLRIATLGDSSTFGLGVHYAESYTARLVQELDKRGVRAEVIAAGVDGYTIRQGLARYLHRVRAWKPDVVVAAFGAVNEHWSADESDDTKIRRLARTRSPARRIAAWTREHLRTAQALAWLRDPGAAERRLKEADKTRAIEQFLAQFAGQADWPFDRRVPQSDFKSTIAELAGEVHADGARCILIAMPRRKEAEDAFPVLRGYTRGVVHAAAEQNLQILLAHARFRYAEKDGDPDPPWFIHDWWHPSPAGHQKLAEWLAPIIADPALNVGRDIEVDELK